MAACAKTRAHVAMALDGATMLLYPGRLARARLRLAINHEDSKMARQCDLTGTGVMTGNNVSHAKNRTRRRFLPNLCKVTLASEALERSFRFRITAAALRSVDHNGGLDPFLLKTSDAKLSANALKVKKQLKKKLAEASA